MKIAAGIVTYNPNIRRLEENIKHIIYQVDVIYLYDNSSVNIDDICNLIQEYNKIIIIKSNKNNGIATALNLILEDCIKSQIDWVLTLDQDSICPDKLISTYLSFLRIDKVGMMTLQVKVKDRIIQQQHEIQHEYEFVTRCITSAAFLNVNIYKCIGRFDDVMFIDCVDHEFSKRMILNGFKILKINNLYLEHELGSSIPIKVTVLFNRVLKTKILYHSYPPIRVYYLERNNIYYLRKFKAYLTKKEKESSIKTIINVACKSLIFEKGKFKYFKAIVLGLYHGLTMKVDLYKPNKNNNC